MPRRKSLRSQLYRAARDLGNVEAAAKGPGALAKRQVRRPRLPHDQPWTGRHPSGLRAERTATLNPR